MPKNEMNTDVIVPPWVIPFSRANYYGADEKSKETKCVHNCYKTYFCCGCVCEPFCVKCDNTHQGHQVLQVFIASHQATVRVKDIEDLFSIGGIQHYSINSKDIVNLKPKPKRSTTNKKATCEICKGQISKEKYNLCSITCKVKKMFTEHGRSDPYVCKHDLNPVACESTLEPLTLPTLVDKGKPMNMLLQVCKEERKNQKRLLKDISNESLPTIGEDTIQDISVKNMSIENHDPTVSLRKRRRKGYPCRAPFF